MIIVILLITRTVSHIMSDFFFFYVLVTIPSASYILTYGSYYLLLFISQMRKQAYKAKESLTEMCKGEICFQVNKGNHPRRLRG